MSIAFQQDLLSPDSDRGRSVSPLRDRYSGNKPRSLEVPQRGSRSETNSACSRTVPSKVSETPCGSVGIRPFWCFRLKSRRITHRCPQIHGNSICYRTVPSRASRMPCGLVFGRFCIYVVKSRRIRTWMPRDSWKLDLLPNRAVESFWETLWLELSLLLCFNGRIS